LLDPTKFGLPLPHSLWRSAPWGLLIVHSRSAVGVAVVARGKKVAVTEAEELGVVEAIAAVEPMTAAIAVAERLAIREVCHAARPLIQIPTVVAPAAMRYVRKALQVSTQMARESTQALRASTQIRRASMWIAGRLFAIRAVIRHEVMQQPTSIVIQTVDTPPITEAA